MNAGLLQTSKPLSPEIQTHRNVDPLLRKQVVKLGAAQVIEKIGGRDRVRTCDPLLAKQVLSQLSYTPTSATGNNSNAYRGVRKPRSSENAPKYELPAPGAYDRGY